MTSAGWSDSMQCCCLLLIMLTHLHVFGGTCAALAGRISAALNQPAGQSAFQHTIQLLPALQLITFVLTHLCPCLWRLPVLQVPRFCQSSAYRCTGLPTSQRAIQLAHYYSSHSAHTYVPNIAVHAVLTHACLCLQMMPASPGAGGVGAALDRPAGQAQGTAREVRGCPCGWSAWRRPGEGEAQSPDVQA
eukprot:scaffold109043_cov19-Tisochrysis_lutea.AAC.1